jgi:hypothetical protein
MIPVWTPPDMKREGVAYFQWVQRWEAAGTELQAMYDDGLNRPPVSCSTPWHLLALCNRAQQTPPGCFVEVGVYRGGSAYQLMRVAKAQKRPLFLYDTFAGMPYCDPSVDTLAVGELASTSEAEVRAALGEYPHIYKCVFPYDVDLPPEGIAFAHIDVDQYKAYMDTCLALAPLMVPGGVMWFDDVPELEGARKAVRELFPAEAIRVDEVSGRWWVEFTA